MEIIKKAFSFRGRMDRKRFFFMFLIIFIPAFIVAIINSQIMSFIFYIIVIPFHACNVVRRFHDLNKSGEYYWLGFIPIYNLYWVMVLFTRKGTVGINIYGDDSTTENEKREQYQSKDGVNTTKEFLNKHLNK